MPDLYVPLDANYREDERFLALQTPFAELLAIRAFAFCKRLRSDGFIYERQAWKEAADLVQYVDVCKVMSELEEAGLWVRVEGGWLVPSWAKHNKTRADLDAEREAEAARKKAWRAKQSATDGHKGPQSATDSPAGHSHATRSNTEQDRAEQVGSDPAATGGAPSRPGRKKPATRVPESFAVTALLRSWAESKNLHLVNLDAETDRFLDHHRAKGSTFSDWNAAWRTWMSRAQQYAAERGRPAANGIAPPADPHGNEMIL